MLKKILALTLCLIMGAAFVACTQTGDGDTNSGNNPTITGTNQSNTNTETDSESNKTESNGATVEMTTWDETMEHKFLATDVANAAVIVVDLGLSQKDDFSDLENCITWEWRSGKDPTCKGNPGKGIDAAKLRYSPYYKRDVVVACSSSGWAGVVDYEAETPCVLWEWSFAGGNFHSIEMMPNGDVVIAGSGDDGKLFYVPLSAGSTSPSHYISSPSGHGVMYDPKNDWLWVLDYDEVFACTVKGAGTKDAKLARIGGCEVKFVHDQDGHVLSPKFGEPGKYWVANSTRNYLFDTETMTFSYAPSHYTNSRNSATKELGIKGIAYYPDRTMIMIVANTGEVSAEHFSEYIRIVRIMPLGGKLQGTKPSTVNVPIYGREFYKVYPLNKNYQ